MKLTKTIPLAVAAAFAASTASAQVAASFDRLVDDVLIGKDAAFFAGAVNTADVDGSIDISAGGVAPGTDTVNNRVVDTLTNVEVSGSNIADAGVASFQGSGSSVEDTGTVSSFLAVNQNFGNLTTVAAGAINDGISNLDQTGSTASVDAGSFTSSTGVDIFADNTTGSTVGNVEGAFNTGLVDGFVNIDMANASGGTGNIGTTAAGAINTSNVTAKFVGGSEATADATLP